MEESWKIDLGLMLKLKTLENKAEIMVARGKLKNSGLWIDEDWTGRDKLVEGWLRRKKERLESIGMEVRRSEKDIVMRSSMVLQNDHTNSWYPCG